MVRDGQAARGLRQQHDGTASSVQIHGVGAVTGQQQFGQLEFTDAFADRWLSAVDDQQRQLMGIATEAQGGPRMSNVIGRGQNRPVSQQPAES